MSPRGPSVRKNSPAYAVDALPKDHWVTVPAAAPTPKERRKYLRDLVMRSPHKEYWNTLKPTSKRASQANTSASRKETPRLSLAEMIGGLVSCQSIFKPGSFHMIVRSDSGS